MFADELTQSRDFLDLFNGVVNDGDSFRMRFGLRDSGSSANNQPFLLVQRANAGSRDDLSEPHTLLLLAIALAGLRLQRSSEAVCPGRAHIPLTR